MKWRLTVGGRGAEAEEDDTCQNQEETIERGRTGRATSHF